MADMFGGFCFLFFVLVLMCCWLCRSFLSLMLFSFCNCFSIHVCSCLLIHVVELFALLLWYLYCCLSCIYQYIHKLDLLSHPRLRDPSKTYDIFVIVGCMCQGQTVLTLDDLGISCLERDKLSPGPRASIWCPGLHNKSPEKTPLSLDRNCQNLKMHNVKFRIKMSRIIKMFAFYCTKNRPF